MEKLSSDELIKLIQSVFPKEPGDKQLAILVDVPRNRDNDTTLWKDRRAIAEGWFHALKDSTGSMGLERVALVAYPDVGSNNADLPETAFFITGNLPEIAEGLPGSGEAVRFERVFSEFQLFLAPTENSTTAPMK
ncbi:MAG: hypothetical protein GY940_41085, partial [bacterium]|nr:hypothetical protein [bacterium]